MFNRAYHTELSFIRELARQFSKGDHPEGLLGEQGGDPDVERLFQGFAFVAAGIRERLEDEVPEVSHELCEAIAPHYLRPLPATTIVEIAADMDSLRERRTVKAGMEVLAKPVEGTACRFRTTADVDLLPLAVEDVSLESARSSSPVLRIGFSGSTGSSEAVFQKGGIRLFIHGDYRVASTLWLWLVRHTCRIEIRSRGQSPHALTLPVGISVPGLCPKLSLLPWPGSSPGGARCAFEYFTLPQKFLFVDLIGLEAARQIGSSFEVVFHFEKALDPGAPISAANFRLHCVPVINLFPATAEPIKLEAGRAEYALTVKGISSEHAAVYSVDRVVSRQRGVAAGRMCVPFSSRAQETSPKGDRAWFQVRRRACVSEARLDTWLSLNTSPDLALEAADEEALMVEMTCTNGSLPGRLGVGALQAEGSSKQLGWNNLVEVSKPSMPVFTNELWRTIGRPAREMLSHASGLRALLRTLDLNLLKTAPCHSANGARIEAVRAVASQAARRIIEGLLMRGLAFQIEVDEAGFASHGDAFLFGYVLNEYLASHVTCNSYIELTLRLIPSNTEFAWQPKMGDLVLV